ncbi:class I SAM-dependent methyltransferase [Synechocystis sp. LEGE 06083]|uniref:class I SAM-dependent methyltransferase n=1 Tax=Synechocystis sp. LEGE 06083 TaxID=915336 RepID=UPI001881B9C4|nr:class I SAM-dependent methyltransferase [Synechocystis sp. LEGE 06083]MBE9196890.1 class I SAM-dependent methyltransferase [Synechocystis sp. LEGE 06083]
MWDERFNQSEYVYGTEPNEFLVSVAGQIPQGKVLCLAEGEGRNACFLASLGYQVTAVDQSSVGLAKAQKLAREKGVKITTIQSNLADFEIIADAWQGIVSIFCHLPSSLRKQLYPRIYQGLKSGGVFILEGFAPEQLQYTTGGPKDLDLLPNLMNLREELSSFAYLTSHTLERHLNEGIYHQGKAALIQVLAKK